MAELCNQVGLQQKVSVSRYSEAIPLTNWLCSTLQVYYSLGNDPLKASEPIANDNSGGGQFQVGVAKKPTETETVVYDGYHEKNIHEGQIYGGIFVEDSATGCVSGTSA